MAAIVAIALNTFREAVRDRVLYSMLLFAVGLILFALVLGRIAPQEQERLTVDVGLATISIMTVLLAIILGGTNLHKEIERKTVYFLLPHPLARWQFLVGKYLGMLWVLLVTLAVTGGTLLTVMAWHERQLQSWVLTMATADVAIAIGLLIGLRRLPHVWPSILALWMVASGVTMATLSQANVALLFQGLGLALAEASVITALALLFSSFSTPFLSGLLTFLVFVAGRQLEWLETLTERIDHAGAERLVALVSAVFPNCYLFVPSVNVLEGRLVIAGAPMAAWELVGHAMSYGFLYTAITLGIAGIVLWRRDFV
jgi:hypothetical protein